MNKLLENENIQVGNLVLFFYQTKYFCPGRQSGVGGEDSAGGCFQVETGADTQFIQINPILLFSRFDSEMTEEEDNAKKIVDVRSEFFL